MNRNLNHFYRIQPLVLRHWLCRQSKPEGEQRVIMLVSDVHGELVHCPKPGARQLASEAVVSKQHISDTLALGTWQPCSHKSINGLDIRLHLDRPARDDDNDTLDRSADGLDCARARFCDRQIGAVTTGLRVGSLPNYNNGIGEISILNEIGVGVLIVHNGGRTADS